jgi:hypothetical protein
MSTVNAARGSVYERLEYLSASAAHVGADVHIVEAADAALPVLLDRDGTRRTVYGFPRPFGATNPPALEALAQSLANDHRAFTAALSPLEPGAMLVRLLIAGGARLLSERPICVAELGDGDPAESFDRRARRSMRTARARDAKLVIGPLTPWFGAFYRSAMSDLSADPIYFFSDGYFESLAGVDHYQVTVEDRHGPAATALFLHDADEAYYHLGGRRAGVEPVLGAMSLTLGEGVREAWRRGCKAAVLGGGRTTTVDDSLFTFKRQLASAVLLRPTVQLGHEGSA